jgi:DNA replication and repair protein RecF
MSVGLQNVRLRSFRSYESLDLNVHGKHVVLTGHNGVGKTNLLEAISLLSPGRGLRKAKMADIQRLLSPDPWVVHAQLWDSGDDLLDIATRLDSDKHRRLVNVSGAPLSTHLDLTHYVTINWATPELDRLFVEGGSSKRRKFFDHLVSGLYPSHPKNLSKYELAVRERNRLLKERSINENWVSSIEEIMAVESVQIAEKRLKTLLQLQSAQDELHEEVKDIRGKIIFSAGLEQETIEGENLSVVGVLERYKASRKMDALTGTTQLGAHKMDFSIIHVAKQMRADFCSTGEQKILLLWLLIASVRLQSLIRTGSSLLLLDEVAAHLDRDRRALLFRVLNQLNIQVWYTGTDVTLFESLEKMHTQYISMTNHEQMRITI